MLNKHKFQNNILGRQKSNQPSFIEINRDNTTVPNAFNAHYLHACEETAVDFEVPQDAYRAYLRNPLNVSLYLTPTTEEEIKKYLDGLKFTAAGIANVPLSY